MTALATDLPGRMSAHVVVDGDCLTWTGAKGTSGYGSCTNGRGGTALAHRRAWLAINGEIPDGLTIDHLCLNKLCVNVEHMEVVTRGENSRRRLALQTECKHGHPLSGDNLSVRIRPDGLMFRECLTCRRANSRRWYDGHYVPASGRRRTKRAPRIMLADSPALTTGGTR